MDNARLHDLRHSAGFTFNSPCLLCASTVQGASDHLADAGDTSWIHQSRNSLITLTTMMTFAIGGLMRLTFLVNNVLMLDQANLIFGGMTVVWTVPSLLGGWLGDRLLRRTPAAYQLVSSNRHGLFHPCHHGRGFRRGPAMYPAIFVGEFFLLLDTTPLNAALREFSKRAASVRLHYAVMHHTHWATFLRQP